MKTSSIAKLHKIIVRIWRKFRLQFSNTIHVSLGENCLTDNILQRNGYKSFSTIFSHSRSNLDYAIQLERENYKNLLEQRYLNFDEEGDNRVVRNNHYSILSNIYHELQTNGFEFTHHDVITNQKHKRSIERKMERMKHYRGKKNINFFYHYRLSENNSYESLLKKAESYLEFYEINGCQCKFIIFSQHLVENKKDKRIVEITHLKNIRLFLFHTLNIWAGDDQNDLWARNDNDLFSKMFRDIING